LAIPSVESVSNQACCPLCVNVSGNGSKLIARSNV